MLVSASILAHRLIDLWSILPTLGVGAIDYIHLDIMDGNFVPQITFGEQLSAEVKETSTKPLDVHLMVSHPEKEIPKYLPLKPQFLTFHYEATNDHLPLAKIIKDAGIQPGLAIKPNTPLSAVQNILPYFDLCLLMTVEPGYYGQAFIESSRQKIEDFIQLKKTCNLPTLLELDGGIKPQILQKLPFNQDINMVVAGSFLFQPLTSPNNQAKLLKQCIHS